MAIHFSIYMITFSDGMIDTKPEITKVIYRYQCKFGSQKFIEMNLAKLSPRHHSGLTPSSPRSRDLQYEGCIGWWEILVGRQLIKSASYPWQIFRSRFLQANFQSERNPSCDELALSTCFNPIKTLYYNSVFHPNNSKFVFLQRSTVVTREPSTGRQHSTTCERPVRARVQEGSSVHSTLIK